VATGVALGMTAEAIRSFFVRELGPRPAEPREREGAGASAVG